MSGDDEIHQAIYPPLICDRVFAHIGVLCAPCDAYLSPPSLSAPQGHCRESTPLSQHALLQPGTAIYNIQLISQRVVPDSQQLLHWQTQTLPPHSHTHTQIR